MDAAAARAPDASNGGAAARAPDASNGCAAAGSDAMLSLTQVSTLLQRMKDEHETLMKQQREDIVQQVMQSLRDSGVVAVAPAPTFSDTVAAGNNNTRANRAARHHVAQSSPPKSQSPHRLEQNLHALVSHSLAESGLDFPHVQRPVYTHAYPAIAMNSSNTSTKTRQPTIIARSEDTSVASRPDEHRSCDADPYDSEKRPEAARQKHLRRKDLSAQTTNANKAASQQRCAAIQRSPLVAASRSHTSDKRRQRRVTTAQHAPRRVNTPTHDNDDDSEDNDDASPYAQAVDPVDAEFARVRNKVGHKTLAILEKSQALLQCTTDSTVGSASSSTKNSFVARLREMQTLDAAAAANTTEAQTVDSHSDAEASTSPLHSPVGEENDAEADDTIECIPDKALSPSNPQCQRVSPSRTHQQQLHDASNSNSIPNLAVPRCDVGLLRPPERSPENENEWENELARQILTIYTTSVKAKAAGIESSSNNSNGVNPRNTPSLTASSRRTASSGAATASATNRQPRALLQSSCSLPALNTRAASTAASATRRPHAAASVHYSWAPSQRLENGRVVVNMPNVPRPIWFAGTGAVKAVWCALAHSFANVQPSNGKSSGSGSGAASAVVAMCDHRLCEQVRRMEATLQFSECIATLESLLVALIRARGSNGDTSNGNAHSLDAKLWKQLIVTCNAFASRCIDYRKFTLALQLVQQAEQLIADSVLVTDTMRLELSAFVYDTYAHYYYRKHKPHAGIQYMRKALAIHTRQSSWPHVAKCRLHMANLLSVQRRHDDAMTHLASILALIEDNKLEATDDSGGGGAASAQKLCLAAVCYNNVAVEQLHLRLFEAASVSAANAKRLARLCLSYSNRWLSQFDATSECAALAIATLMEDANATGRDALDTLTAVGRV